MGTSLSRQNAAVEEADVTLNHPYKYPPRTGNYRHFNLPIKFWGGTICGVVMCAVVLTFWMATNEIDIDI